MKKSLLLVSILLSIQAFGMELDGWKVTNTTNAPIGLRWYKTKVATRFSGRYVWGDKEAISELFELGSYETTFLPLPLPQNKMDGYSVRRELVVTCEPLLLEDVVAADTSGNITNKKQKSSFVIKNKDSLPKQAFLVVKPEGTNTLCISTQDALAKDSWTCTNVSDKPVYCRWYRAKKCNGTFKDPQAIKGHSVIAIKPSQTCEICFPKGVRGTQRQLLLRMCYEPCR